MAAAFHVLSFVQILCKKRDHLKSKQGFGISSLCLEFIMRSLPKLWELTIYWQFITGYTRVYTSIDDWAFFPGIDFHDKINPQTPSVHGEVKMKSCHSNKLLLWLNFPSCVPCGFGKRSWEQSVQWTIFVNWKTWTTGSVLTSLCPAPNA